MRARTAVSVLVIAAAGAACGAAPSASATPRSAPRDDGPWRTLEPGLELTRVQLRGEAIDEGVLALRVDPRRFRLRLLNMSAEAGSAPLTPQEWAARHRLVAVINASMYQEDGRTSVGLMKTEGHVNNKRLGKDKAILAFDPVRSADPPVRIIDRECESFSLLAPRYRTLVQSIRMVSCRGKNVWARSTEGWSTAAVGLDGDGRVLLVHARAAWPTHDLIDVLLSAPLSVTRALYTEGGPQAQLYVNAGGEELDRAGRPESPLLQGAAPLLSWPVPNVIGVARR